MAMQALFGKGAAQTETRQIIDSALRADPSVPTQSREAILAILAGGVLRPAGPYALMVTPAELARYLNVSVDTLERMEKAGLLPRPLRTKPLGSGRGRSVIRWDLWRVLRHLEGTSET
jgi:hypothetical protein